MTICITNKRKERKKEQITNLASYLVVIFSVESDDVKIEDRALCDDDGDGREAEEAVIEDLPVAHRVGRAGPFRTFLRSSSFRHGDLFTALSSCGHTEDRILDDNTKNAFSRQVLFNAKVFIAFSLEMEIRTHNRTESNKKQNFCKKGFDWPCLLSLWQVSLHPLTPLSFLSSDRRYNYILTDDTTQYTYVIVEVDFRSKLQVESKKRK